MREGGREGGGAREGAGKGGAGVEREGRMETESERGGNVCVCVRDEGTEGRRERQRGRERARERERERERRIGRFGAAPNASPPTSVAPRHWSPPRLADPSWPASDPAAAAAARPAEAAGLGMRRGTLLFGDSDMIQMLQQPFQVRERKREIGETGRQAGRQTDRQTEGGER